MEPVDGRLRKKWVGHEAEPLDRLAIGGDDGGRGAVTFNDDLVDVRCVERVEGLEREVVDLSRPRHSWTYADSATIPTRGGAPSDGPPIVRPGRGVTHKVTEVRATDAKGHVHELRADVLRVEPGPRGIRPGATIVNEGLARWTYKGRVGYGISEYLHQLDEEGRPVVAIQ